MSRDRRLAPEGTRTCCFSFDTCSTSSSLSVRLQVSDGPGRDATSVTLTYIDVVYIVQPYTRQITFIHKKPSSRIQVKRYHAVAPIAFRKIGLRSLRTASAAPLASRSPHPQATAIRLLSIATSGVTSIHSSLNDGHLAKLKCSGPALQVRHL